MRDGPLETLYFDKPGIDDLLNQISRGRLETFPEEAGGANRVQSGESKPKFSLYSIIKPFSGLKINFGAEPSSGTTKTSTESFVVNRDDRYDRYDRVVDQLGGIPQLRHTLERAWHLALSSGSGVFCIVDAVFKPVHTTSDLDAWQVVANNLKFLQLIDSTGEHFRIGMSFEKMSGLRDGRILPSSHLTRRLKRGANLRVFGKMDKSRYIKPFVVSWN